MSAHAAATGAARVPSRPQCETLEKRLARLAEAGPDAIGDRLAALEREWSIGRMVKATTGVVILVGSALAIFVNPWWSLLTAGGGLLLAEYLFFPTGWMGNVFREMGYRSGTELTAEKLALRTLRGDFKCLPTVHEIEDKDAILRLEGEGGIAIEPDVDRPSPADVAKLIAAATA